MSHSHEQTVWSYSMMKSEPIELSSPLALVSATVVPVVIG
jgi:hypothetical protein